MKHENKAKKASSKTEEAINHPGMDPIGEPGTQINIDQPVNAEAEMQKIQGESEGMYG